MTSKSAAKNTAKSADVAAQAAPAPVSAEPTASAPPANRQQAISPDQAYMLNLMGALERQRNEAQSQNAQLMAKNAVLEQLNQQQAAEIAQLRARVAELEKPAEDAAETETEKAEPTA